MRIAVFSDVHGNLRALEAVLDDIALAGVDAHLCIGDLVLFGPRPVDVLDRLDAIEDLLVVRGNTDRWLGLVRDLPDGPFQEKVVGKVRRDILWTLDQLPPERVDALVELPPVGCMEWEGTRLRVEHGAPGFDAVGISPDLDDERIAEMLVAVDERGFACGHTHEPMTRQVGGVTVVNDGSVGFPYDGVPLPSWALVELGRGGVLAEVRRVEVDREAIRRDIESARLPRAEVMVRRLETARM